MRRVQVGFSKLDVRVGRRQPSLGSLSVIIIIIVIIMMIISNLLWWNIECLRPHVYLLIHVNTGDDKEHLDDDDNDDNDNDDDDRNDNVY